MNGVKQQQWLDLVGHINEGLLSSGKIKSTYSEGVMMWQSDLLFATDEARGKLKEVATAPC